MLRAALLALVAASLAVAPASAQDGPAGDATTRPETAPGQTAGGETAAGEGSTGEPATGGSGSVAAEPVGDPATVEEARRHYAQGVVFFRAERFEEAIAEFEEAFALWENPTILFSLGQSYERLLRVPRALDAYRRFLDAVPGGDPRRAQVEDTIRGLETILAALVVDVNVPARVWANGEDVGAAPGRIQLATGRYDVEVRADGYVTHREAISLAARTERTLHVLLERAPDPTVVVESSGVEPTFFWIGLAATGAAAVATTIVGGITLDAAARYQSAELRTQAMRDEGQRLALATDLLGGGTALFALTTLVLALVTDWDGPPPARATAGGISVEF